MASEELRAVPDCYFITLKTCLLRVSKLGRKQTYEELQFLFDNILERLSAIVLNFSVNLCFVHVIVYIPITPSNSHERSKIISPYNIETISIRHVMRIKKNIGQGISG